MKNVSVSAGSCINCLVGIQHTSVGLTGEWRMNVSVWDSGQGRMTEAPSG